MNISKFLVLIMLSMMAMASSLANAESKSNHGPSKVFSPAFNQMKTLAGNWVGLMNMAGKEMKIKVNYKVSSAGSSVVETTFPGSPREMVTVYTDEKGKVNMTHYCALQNQPRLRSKKSNKDFIEFDFVSGANLDVKKDAHMHHLTLKFKNKDSIEQHWTQFKDGKSMGVNVMALSRVK